jgi:hypothetical protein
LNIKCVSLFSVQHHCYLPRPPHTPSFGHPNNIQWLLQVMKLSAVTSLMGPSTGVAKSKVLLPLVPSLCHQPLNRPRYASFTGPPCYRHDPGQHTAASVMFRRRNWFLSMGLIITCTDWKTYAHRIMLTRSEPSRPSYRRTLRAHTSSCPRHKIIQGE